VTGLAAAARGQFPRCEKCSNQAPHKESFVAIFEIYARPGQDSETRDAVVSVADRFSWLAALLPPVWAAVNGVWLALVLWLGAVVTVFALGLYLGSEAAVWLYVAGAVLFGFEAPALKGASLRRRGWLKAGEVIAGHRDAAELVHFRDRRDVS